MKVINRLKDMKIEDDTVIAIGNFDGLHIGHMEVINGLIRQAKSHGCKSLIYTFANHTTYVTNPDAVPPHILSVEQKTHILEKSGVDILAIPPFDVEHMNIEPLTFIKEVLVKGLKAKHLIVGHDFKFGKKASGNIDMIKEYADILGYTYTVVSPIMLGDVRISSTFIRKLLLEGRIRDANLFLGRKHSVFGEVVVGKKVGSTIGYPTANLRVTSHMTLMKSGVYVTRTKLRGKMYDSVTNVGFNPTFDQDQFNLETYIFGWKEKLYGEHIEVFFHDRIRDEVKFESLDQLVDQIDQDVIYTRQYFERN